MSDALTSFFATAGFLPHGYCFTWNPSVLWSMVVADAVIALSYFSIPLAIQAFLQHRRDFTHRRTAVLFGVFIAGCGLTHVADIWTVWVPDYGLQAVVKIFTAVISLVTAVSLWPLLPKLLRIPSVAQLQAAIDSLQTEIRKRKSAEDHLRDTEQTLSLALGSIGAGFLSCDAEGRITRMNAVAEQITGWPQDAARGRALHEVLVPSPDNILPPPDFKHLGALVSTRERVLGLRLRGRSGNDTSAEVTVAATHDEQGQMIGATMLIRDLTQLRNAETELNRLAAIVESSNDAIVSKTLDGRITSWNRGAQDVFGYTAEEAIGQSALILIPPDRADEEMNILASLADGRKVPHFETVRRTKDGSLIDVSVAISPIRDAAGHVVGGSKIARNVTQQRRAEQALREGEARLRVALDSAHLGEWEMDLATEQTRRSLRHDQCFGYAELQPAWSFDALLSHVQPQDRPSVLGSFRQAVQSERDWHAEFRVLWPDGSEHWISMVGSVIREPGRHPRMLGIIADITAARQAEQARLRAQRLQAENEQIIEANRVKSLFLANMSHELRTPLNAIIGFADLMNSGAVPPNSPKHSEFLGYISTSGRHLLQLINDVLDLSKVESGKFEFAPEPVDLPRLVQEVVGVLKTLIDRKSLDVQVQIDPTLVGLELDASRFKQVLYNYLSNAIKFTPEGGSIVARALPEGEHHFRFEVEDTGIGIAPEDLPRLFVEFQQLDDSFSKKHQGTGLGLALTRRLVEAQGGSVGVRSAPGVGSVFHLVLPRVHSAQSSTAQTTQVNA